RLPGLENRRGLLFPAKMAQFTAYFLGSYGLGEAAFHGQRKPFLGARLDGEFHASGVANGAQEPHRLIGETVNRKSAHFPFLDVGEAIGGIEQQTARGGVQRECDGVYGEIAAAEILHDRGPADLGACSRTSVDVFTSGGNAAVDVPE